MTYEIQLAHEKRGLKKVVSGSANLRPDLSRFKDLPPMENLQLGGKPAVHPIISVDVKAEKGLFSSNYIIVASFMGTMPMSNGPGGIISGYSDVSKNTVRYYTPEGEYAGMVNRMRVPTPKTEGITVGKFDEFSLGIEGKLMAVMRYVSDVPLFASVALNVLKAVAGEAGDIGIVKKD
jgi:hypothetical protein